jgi:hypothetical protein
MRSGGGCAGSGRALRLDPIASDTVTTVAVSCLSNEQLTLCQLFRRLLFGGFHLCRISCHISGKDRGQTALHANSPRGD